MSRRQDAGEQTPLLTSKASRDSYQNRDIPYEEEIEVGTSSSNDENDHAEGHVGTHEREANFVGKLIATYYSFTLVGGIDGAYGVLIHYFSQYYHTNYLGVSVILLSPVVGYTIAALINEKVHRNLGQRGVAMLGPGCHTLAFVIATQRPAYILLVLLCVLAGLGSGLIDAGWNAWLGAMPNSNGLLGGLHGFYGLGAALTPVLATALIEKAGWQWYQFYYLLAGIAATELCTSLLAFWSETGARHVQRQEAGSHPENNSTEGNSYSKSDKQDHSLLDALKRLSTWIVSLFIFLYAGVELSFADWILTVLVDTRHESEITGSAVTFAYWGGLTIGRVVIGFLIPVLKTEKHHVTFCLVVVLTFQLVFAFVSNLPVTAIALFLVGFFHGPLFPEAVIMQTKLLPKSLHITAVGFSCALGSAGGSVMPFIVGVIANKSSIRVLHPALTVMIVLMMGLWLVLPRPSAKRK